MLNIVFGLIAMSLGFWCMVTYWWYMVDVLIALLPLVLFLGGIIALLAGIRNTGVRSATRAWKGASHGPEPTPRKKDE